MTHTTHAAPPESPSLSGASDAVQPPGAARAADLLLDEHQLRMWAAELDVDVRSVIKELKWPNSVRRLTGAKIRAFLVRKGVRTVEEVQAGIGMRELREADACEGEP